MIISGNSSRRSNRKIGKTQKDSKKTKIIGGHAMAIRDNIKSRQGKQAKLNDHCKWCCIVVLVVMLCLVC